MSLRRESTGGEPLPLTSGGTASRPQGTVAGAVFMAESVVHITTETGGDRSFALLTARTLLKAAKKVPNACESYATITRSFGAFIRQARASSEGTRSSRSSPCSNPGVACHSGDSMRCVHGRSTVRWRGGLGRSRPCLTEWRRRRCGLTLDKLPSVSRTYGRDGTWPTRFGCRIDV